MEIPEGCEEEVLGNLQDLLQMRLRRAREAKDHSHEEALFDAQQNARVVANAENYYRTMFDTFNDCTWEIRDEVCNISQLP